MYCFARPSETDAIWLRIAERERERERERNSEIFFLSRSSNLITIARVDVRRSLRFALLYGRACCPINLKSKETITRLLVESRDPSAVPIYIALKTPLEVDVRDSELVKLSSEATPRGSPRAVCKTTSAIGSSRLQISRRTRHGLRKLSRRGKLSKAREEEEKEEEEEEENARIDARQHTRATSSYLPCGSTCSQARH